MNAGRTIETAEQQRLALLLDLHPSETLLVAPDGRLLYVNQRAQRLLRDAGGGGAHLDDLLSPLDEPARHALAVARSSSGWQPLSLSLRNAPADAPRTEFRGRGVPRDGGPPDLLLVADAERQAAFHERAERIRHLNAQLALQQRTEQQLRRALDTGRRLHHELVHRVKNNLAVLSAVVRSTGRVTRSEEARQVLDDIARRITAISLSHEILDRTNEVDMVSAQQLFATLIEQLNGSLCPPGIEVRGRIDPVTLHVQVATPLCILVNELVTNAIKHAFRGRDEGVVEILLEAVDGDGVRLRVADNGSGFDPAAQRRGSGSHIVDALALQLEGRLSYDGSNGSVWQLEMPLPPPAPGADPAAREG